MEKQDFKQLIDNNKIVIEDDINYYQYLRSKSLYYLSVKEVTNHYLSRGVFLSDRMKLELVDDLSINFSQWKWSLNNFKQGSHPITLEYLKNEVVAYIWESILNSSYPHKLFGIWKEIGNSSNKFLKNLNLNMGLKLSHKEFLKIAILNSLRFRGNKSFIETLAQYKTMIFRLLKQKFDKFYFCRKLLTFIADFYFLISRIRICDRTFKSA